MLDNVYEFKLDFTSLLKYFDIKPVLTTIKNPQADAPIDRVHQVILNMPVTKDIDNKCLDYIYTWGETLASIVWVIKASYYHTIHATSGQSGFWQRHNIQPRASHKLVSYNRSKAAECRN